MENFYRQTKRLCGFILVISSAAIVEGRFPLSNVVKTQSVILQHARAYRVPRAHCIYPRPSDCEEQERRWGTRCPGCPKGWGLDSSDGYSSSGKDSKHEASSQEMNSAYSWGIAIGLIIGTMLVPPQATG